MKFRLRVFLDPKRHVVSPRAARQHPYGYGCGCPVSRAVNAAVAAEGSKRFRRWARAWAHTGMHNVTLYVEDRSGRRRRYEARLTSGLWQQRHQYDVWQQRHQYDVRSWRGLAPASGELEFRQVRA